MSDRPAQTLETLHDVATDLQSADSGPAVCERTVAAAAEILQLHRCSVILRDGAYLDPCATSAAAPPGGSRRMHIDQGLAGKTYQTQESTIIEEITSEDETDPADPSYRSAISVPIGDHGVFQAVETIPGAFDKEDLELAELLLSHTVTALNRLDRERDLQAQIDRLDQFAAGVGHELTTPLNVAQGTLELAAEDCASPHHEAIEESLDRIEHRLEKLLTFARVGPGALATEPVALDDLAETCWSRLTGPEATLQVETTRVVEADPDRLREVFENLFANAIDHAGPIVTITVGALRDGFYVADDGPGIDADEAEAVFEAGYSSGTDGTGFGLSIVDQIVAAHGWTIDVTEADSGGTRFEITGVEFLE